MKHTNGQSYYSEVMKRLERLGYTEVLEPTERTTDDSFFHYENGAIVKDGKRYYISFSQMNHEGLTLPGTTVPASYISLDIITHEDKIINAEDALEVCYHMYECIYDILDVVWRCGMRREVPEPDKTQIMAVKDSISFFSQARIYIPEDMEAVYDNKN